MVDQVIDGVKLPDDEDLVIIPDGYPDSIITKEHWAQKGESIVSCNFAVQDPLQKIGQEVSCPDCGKKFKIVLLSSVAQVKK